jgi:hypothetical protein
MIAEKDMDRGLRKTSAQDTRQEEGNGTYFGESDSTATDLNAN